MDEETPQQTGLLTNKTLLPRNTNEHITTCFGSEEEDKIYIKNIKTHAFHVPIITLYHLNL